MTCLCKKHLCHTHTPAFECHLKSVKRGQKVPAIATTNGKWTAQPSDTGRMTDGKGSEMDGERGRGVRGERILNKLANDGYDILSNDMIRILLDDAMIKYSPHTHTLLPTSALVLTFDFCWLWFHHRWTFFPGSAADACCVAVDGYHVSRHCLLATLHEMKKKKRTYFFRSLSLIETHWCDTLVHSNWF